MAVNQNNLKELRYIKRQNLTQESKIIGNYYRDLLRSYGIDCNYYKLKIPFPEIFNVVVNKNNVVKTAYGEDPDPNYKLSAEMITYMEVENDIFQLNKFGVVPSTNVNFYFDSTDFATALAFRLGQYKEYPIYEQTIDIDFSEKEADKFEDLIIPFACDILSGECLIPLGSSEMEIDLGKEVTIDAEILNITEPQIDFPVNEYIYKSFNYEVKAREADDVILKFTLKAEETDRKRLKYTLSGKLHGVVLFRDLRLASKYSESIHPEVGDIITIDFPDAKSREQYEITEASDINLASDGINPLLHKYIWKCKAIRFVPNASTEIPEKNEYNSRLLEKMDLENTASEVIAAKISEYPNNEDKAYGGYSRTTNFDDLNALKTTSKKKISINEIQDKDSMMVIADFSRCKLKTNGFDLYFVDSNENYYKLTQFEENKQQLDFNVNGDIDFIKATNDMLVFINVAGEQKILCQLTKDKEELLELSANDYETEKCLVSLTTVTTYGNGFNNINSNGDVFYKFANCYTILLVVDDNLYCNFPTGQLFKLN